MPVLVHRQDVDVCALSVVAMNATSLALYVMSSRISLNEEVLAPAGEGWLLRRGFFHQTPITRPSQRTTEASTTEPSCLPHMQYNAQTLAAMIHIPSL